MANRQLVVRPIQDAVNPGMVHLVNPPVDVLDSLSQFVYQAIISIIQYDNRVLYEGVPVDDGWALLRHLHEAQAHLDMHIDLLEARRCVLQCKTLAEYPTFKSSILQLKHDWDSAINNLFIAPDDEWSQRKTKRFISDRTRSIFGEDLSIWNADPANQAKTVGELLEKATSCADAEETCRLHVVHGDNIPAGFGSPKWLPKNARSTTWTCPLSTK